MSPVSDDNAVLTPVVATKYLMLHDTTLSQTRAECCAECECVLHTIISPAELLPLLLLVPRHQHPDILVAGLLCSHKGQINYSTDYGNKTLKKTEGKKPEKSENFVQEMTLELLILNMITCVLQDDGNF